MKPSKCLSIFPAEVVMANKVWVVETLHRDSKIGWVPLATWMHRAQAWEAKRYHQQRWPAERYRTVSYERSGDGEK